MISGSSAFSKSSLNIRKFTVHAMLKPGLENFELYFTSLWDECNCVVIWTFFGISHLWDRNENWPSPVLWSFAAFSKFAVILSASLSQHHLLGFEIVQLFNFFFFFCHFLCFLYLDVYFFPQVRKFSAIIFFWGGGGAFFPSKSAHMPNKKPYF